MRRAPDVRLFLFTEKIRLGRIYPCCHPISPTFRKVFLFFQKLRPLYGHQPMPSFCNGKDPSDATQNICKRLCPNKNTFTSALSNPFIRSRRSASTVRSSLERRLFADYFLLQRFSLLNYCYYKHSLRSLSTV